MRGLATLVLLGWSMHNPRRSAFPYIIRIRSGQKALTGPRGLPCLPPKKGTP